MKRPLSLWCAAAVMAAAAIPNVAHGIFGDITFGPVDIEGQTGETGNLGIAFLNDTYYVSARALVAAPHKVFTFDTAGMLLASFDQHPIVHPGPWGYRDGTNDGTLLYFGNEDGIFSHNPDGSNAQQVIAGAGPNGNYRALAYDPTGDGGNGSFWSANFDSSLVEVSRTGAVLTTFPNLDGWSLYGLELDPQTGNLWGHHGVRPSGTSATEVREIDTTTGRETGMSFESTGGLPEFPANGGLTVVPGGAGDGPGDLDVVVMQQSTPDSIVGFEIRSASTQMWMDGQDFPPLAPGGVGGVPAPVTDPLGNWHELRPTFCTNWTADDWIDNGSGDLDACDFLLLNDGAATSWWHVDLVTVTVYLCDLGACSANPGDWRYIDYIGATGQPGAVPEPYREIYPVFDQQWTVANWQDIDGDQKLSVGDVFILDSPTGGTPFTEIAGVATDLTLTQEDPPGQCPGDVNGDNVVDVLDLLEVLTNWGPC